MGGDGIAAGSQHNVSGVGSGDVPNTSSSGRRGGARQTSRGTDVDEVTCHDYNMVMKNVGIADLKARLSEYLNEVRKGRTLTVLDRRTPVARIVPYSAAEPLEVRRATRRARDIALPRPPSRNTDSLAVLVEDRGRR
jgi:prevent-host-death family protein